MSGKIVKWTKIRDPFILWTKISDLATVVMPNSLRTTLVGLKSDNKTKMQNVNRKRLSAERPKKSPKCNEGRDTTFTYPYLIAHGFCTGVSHAHSFAHHAHLHGLALKIFLQVEVAAKIPRLTANSTNCTDVAGPA